MVRTGKPLTMNRPTDGDALKMASMKESVAAHQATCGCHVVTFKALGSVDDMIACCGRRDAGDVRDHDGNRWHIDPLCKVRPEAKG